MNPVSNIRPLPTTVRAAAANKAAAPAAPAPANNTPRPKAPVLPPQQQNGSDTALRVSGGVLGALGGTVVGIGAAGVALGGLLGPQVAMAVGAVGGAALGAVALAGVGASFARWVRGESKISTAAAVGGTTGLVVGGVAGAVGSFFGTWALGTLIPALPPFSGPLLLLGGTAAAGLGLMHLGAKIGDALAGK